MRKLLFILLSALSATAFGQVAANFAPDKNAGCPPLVVNFTDLSSPNTTSWKWNFNNGNTSTLQNPSATFLNPGIYKVKLIASNGIQTDTIDKIITVFKLPVVDFVADKTSACLSDTINFQNLVTPGDAPITDYAWGFGNGLAASGSSAHYKYQQTGTYSITLVVQDSNGCSANKTIANYVQVSPVPQAMFTATPTSSCNPSQVVTFTNQSTGNGLTYSWSFGDSTFSTQTDPTHLYQNIKCNAVLTVTNSFGCTSKKTVSIKVMDLVANFNVTRNIICAGEQVQFSNTSNFAGTSWYWDFGDGTTSTSYSPQKMYNNPGVYDVTLVVQDGACRDSITKVAFMGVNPGMNIPNVAFSADTTFSCGSPLTVHFTNNTNVPPGCTFYWNFGNATGSADENPTITYNAPGSYSITLVITDSNGCSISGQKVNFIRTRKPAPNFKSDTLICPGTPVHFYNYSQFATSYLWDFGDGDTSSLPNPVHTYANFGAYNITLTATSSVGCDSTITKTNYIKADSFGLNFAVNATFSPCPPFVALFSNLSKRSDLQYKWVFGDGYTDTTKNPTHIYYYPGVYTVKLIGKSPLGCTDTLVYPDLITVQGPTGNFTASPKSGCSPLTVSFLASPSSNTKTMWCDFGDGNISLDSTNITHIYINDNIYHPQFVLTDYVGCSVSYPTDSIIVHALPPLIIKDTSVCIGNTATVSLDSNQVSYKWIPSTYLNCDTCQTVTINAPDTVTYHVAVANKFGCQAEGDFTLNVEALPSINDSATFTSCPDDMFNLNIGYAASMSWSPPTFLNDSSSVNPVCVPQNSITYSVNAYNRLGCGVTTTVHVVVKDKVEVTVPNLFKVCPYDTVQLQSTLVFGSNLGANYYWTPSRYLNDAKLPNPIASMQNAPIQFKLITTSGHCIPDTDFVNVLLNPVPDLEVSQNVFTTPNAEVELYAASHHQLTYQWYAQDSLSCTDCRRPVIYPSVSQTVYVEGKNEFGCITKDSVHIEVKDCDPNSIFMPNTFTPNGDGINDKFFIRGKTLAGLKFFRVFDEWGQLVFETKQLNEGWDGTTRGKTEATGVYVYILEGECQNGGTVIKNGNITAIR